MSRHREQRPPTWLDSPRNLDLLHRVGAVVLGLALWLFGTLGLVNRLDPFSARGEPVLGLSSNGLLSVVSLVVGAVLIAAAVRGGRTASTVIVVIGALFVLSGAGGVLVLGTELNLLAFGPSNVVFSLVAGGILLVLGAYGRFIARRPTNNVHRRGPHPGGGPTGVLPTVRADRTDHHAPPSRHRTEEPA